MRCVGPAMLVRVQVVVILRRLHERYARVFEITERLDEKIAPRCMIGVEHRDQLAAAARESVVEIAGLRMRIISTRQILTSELGRQSSHRLPAPIIENPGAMWIVHRHCRQCRLAYQVDRLAVGGDVHIDADARTRRWRAALRQPPAHEYVHQRRDETKQLRAVDQRREDRCVGIESLEPPAEIPETDGDEAVREYATRRLEPARGDDGCRYHFRYA